MSGTGQPWRLTNHVCRRCFGRVLEGDATGGGRVFRCAQYVYTAESDDATSICCCGIKLKGGKDAGIRCMANDERSSENPHEVVAEQVGG